MSRSSIYLALAAALSLAAACRGEGDEGGSPKTAEGGAVAGTYKLPQLGLQIDIGGKVKITEDWAGRKNSMTVASKDVGDIHVEVDPVLGKLETLKEMASTSRNLANERNEALPDGFVYMYESDGTLGRDHAVYVVRAIGGRQVMCSSSNSRSDADRGVILAACKTLRSAP